MVNPENAIDNEKNTDQKENKSKHKNVEVKKEENKN